MAFNGNMANDEAYVNGIGRFEIQVNDAAAEVTWSQSKSHRVYIQKICTLSQTTIGYQSMNLTTAGKPKVTLAC